MLAVVLMFDFPFTSPQILTKKKLQDLVREVDPNEQLDEDVEEVGLCAKENPVLRSDTALWYTLRWGWAIPLVLIR